MIVDAVRSFLAGNAIEGPFLLALSGGVDSTALLAAFVELGGVSFEAAHVNHHLRGADSDSDEAFVRELCARFDVPLTVFEGPLDPKEIRRSGIETAARKVRYAKLHQAGARWMVTAHQKNDQAETILMRLISGGGLAALRGIHPIRSDGIIRPLLTVTRAEIDAFLTRRGIEARMDASNADPRFLRNRIRAVLTQLGPGAVDSLAAIAEQAREQWAVVQSVIDASDSAIATETETRFVEWPDDPWLRRALLHRHIHRLDAGARDISAADLARLANDAAKRISVTANLELIRKGAEVILRKRPLRPEAFEFEMRAGESRSIPQIQQTITIRRPASGERQAFQLPPGAVPTFTVRNRREGDRFHPLGMAQEKKLKDFLIDRKIPAEARDRIPLLVWNGAIVWVAGVEISEAFKLTGGEGATYEVSIEETNQEGVQRETHRQPRR